MWQAGGAVRVSPHVHATLALINLCFPTQLVEEEYNELFPGALQSCTLPLLAHCPHTRSGPSQSW